MLLTPREWEIVLRRGEHPEVIALRLGLSWEEVEAHLSAAEDRLRARTTARAPGKLMTRLLLRVGDERSHWGRRLRA